MIVKKLNKWNDLNIIAFIYAVTVTLGGSFILSRLSAQPFNFIGKLVPLILRTIIVYLPFSGLYLFGSKQIKQSGKNYIEMLKIYIIGIMASSVLWVYYYVNGYLYIVSKSAGLTSDAMGTLLLISPALIGTIMYIANKIVSRKNIMC